MKACFQHWQVPIFCDTGVWTQDFMCSREVLCHWASYIPSLSFCIIMTREKWCERQAEADIMWTTLAFEKNEAQLVIITWSRNLGQRVKLGQELSAWLEFADFQGSATCAPGGYVRLLQGCCVENTSLWIIIWNKVLEGFAGYTEMNKVSPSVWTPDLSLEMQALDTSGLGCSHFTLSSDSR